MIGAAFLMGLVGSMHCIGMCGPLALVANRLAHGQPVLNSFVYNGARIGVYVVLGLLFGLIGQVALLNGMQQWLSVGIGLSIILLAITMIFKPQLNHYLTGQFGFVFKVLSKLNRLDRKGTKSTALLGLINGFLPCGLVYMAVAGSVVQPSLFDSAIFMLAFGFGTLPLMFSISASGSGLLNLVRGNYRKVLSFGLFAFGFFLVYRGMGMEFVTLLNNTLDPTAGIINCK